MAPKKWLILVSFAYVVGLVYLRGNSDGRNGRELFSTAIPQIPPEFALVNARARDFNATNNVDLAPNKMRVIDRGTGMVH